MSKIIYSYDYIDEICRKMANNILNEYKPDLIVGIGGGGLIPARIMRSVIKKPIYTISVSCYDENDNRVEEPIINQWFENNDIIKSKKILIVDEVDDTRKTISFLLPKIKNLEPEEICISVIHNKTKKKEDIDLSDVKMIVGEEVEDRWIVYPWD